MGGCGAAARRGVSPGAGRQGSCRRSELCAQQRLAGRTGEPRQCPSARGAPHVATLGHMPRRAGRRRRCRCAAAGWAAGAAAGPCG